MSEAIHTSLKRYERVHEILKSDNALKRKLSTRMVAVCKPDNSFVDFPVEVVHVTDAIHKQGLDAYSLPKMEVMRFGLELLVKNTSPIPMPTSPVKPAVKPAPKPAPKAPVKKPVPAKKAAKPTAPPAAEKPAARKGVPKATATAASRPAPVEPTPAGEAKPAAPKAYVRPYMPYVMGVAVLSLLESINVLLQPHIGVGDNDAKEMSQKTNELINEFHRRTVLPSTEKSAEKEPTTSAS